MNKKTTMLQALIANKNVRSILLFGSLLFGAGAMAQTTYYVKPEATGTGDGTSWENAGADLQLAINTAVAGDNIFVAAGTYKPNREANALTVVTATADPDNAFVLKEGVKIYGSFAGTEATLADRDLTLTENVSILSGDFLGDDVITGTAADLVITNNTENAYHVVLSVGGVDAPITEATVLDGFTIRGGNASTSFGSVTINTIVVNKFTGGGMANYNAASPMLTNLNFTANTASYGGALYNKTNSSPVISNNTITGNVAEVGGGIANWAGSAPLIDTTTITANLATAGGGIYNYDAAAPVLTTVTISGNFATTGSGGGMFNNSSSPSLTDVTVTNNTAASNGGGIHSTVGSAAVINNSVISENIAIDGGGFYNDDASAPMLTNTSIIGNHASGIGGGMYNNNAAPQLQGVSISENTAAISGGGIANWSESPALITDSDIFENGAPNGAGIYNNDNSAAILTNVRVANNIATQNGGGIYNRLGSNAIITSTLVTGNTAENGAGVYNTDESSPVLTNVTITQNTATSQGGGISNNNSNPVVRNSILFNNSDTAGVNIFNFNNSTTTFSHSLVQYTSAIGWDAIGTDGGNNIDLDPLFYGNSFTFTEQSPAINAGSNIYYADEQTPDLSGIITDLAGNDRIYDDVVDLGAFEFQGQLRTPDFTIATIKYYPNPVVNQLSIDAPATITNVSVYNMLGQVVVSEDWNANTGVLNMAQLKAGNYIVKVTAGKMVKNSIVVKQ